MTSAWLLCALPAALPAGVVLLNAATWRRPPPGGRFEGRLSVLVPARDEAANIVACVEAVFASDTPVHELLVYDDGSTDSTPVLLAELARRHPRLRVLPGVPLPPGWVGKPHATHRLAAAATGDVLLFLDADVRLAPDGLSRVASALGRPGLDGRVPGVVTGVPAQETGTLAERLLLPLLHLSYEAWLPLALVRLVRDPRVVAANGQLFAARRAAYEAAGGFAAVRAEVVDDVAFARRAKRVGVTVHVFDAQEVASCRMYRSGGEVVAGFSKNVFEGVGGSVPALVGVVGLHVLCFVVPYAVAGAWAVGLVPAAWGLPGVVGVGLNLLARGVLALRHRHPIGSVLAHPVAVLALVGIAVRSALWSRRGAIRWRGRSYAARDQRAAAAAGGAP